MYLAITDVKPLDNYKLLLKFENDEKKTVDISPYLEMGKFAELKDKSMFNTVTVDFDTIKWANNLDLDPEFLYNLQ